jgi:hypothetical protein
MQDYALGSYSTVVYSLSNACDSLLTHSFHLYRRYLSISCPFHFCIMSNDSKSRRCVVILVACCSMVRRSWERRLFSWPTLNGCDTEHRTYVTLWDLGRRPMIHETSPCHPQARVWTTWMPAPAKAALEKAQQLRPGESPTVLGLDARSASVVMRSVKQIALTGRAVCATIHQPSIAIFNSFGSLSHCWNVVVR